MARTSALRVVAVSLLNPLPADISVKDIVEAAGFFDPKASDEVSAFRIEYTWGGSGVDIMGNYEYDQLTLNPGDSIETPEDAANTVLKGLKDLGVVKVRKNDDLVVKALEGLHAALEHYRERGEMGYLKFQQRHALNDEQMKLQRNTLRPYLINMEKAKAIEAEIERLTSKPKSFLKE